MANDVNGIALDREVGEFNLSHRDMKVGEDTKESATNASNRRCWEPPAHLILTRGGVFMDPRDTRIPPGPANWA
jgi:fructose-1,6-bisphosphatase